MELWYLKGYEHLEVYSEEQLWKNYVDTRDITIRNYFVEKYADLVRFVAHKVMAGVPSSVTYDDLVSYGIIGLVDAIDKYDLNRENKFKTYAVTRIRGAIFDELRNIDWLPRSVRSSAKEIEKATSQVELKLGRAAKDEEVATHMSLPLAEFHRRVMRVSNNSLISMDENWFMNDGNDNAPMSIEETLENAAASNPNMAAERSELKKMISSAISELPDNEQKVLILYYYEELTLKEIGSILTVTESRVSQIHRDALDKLRNKLKDIQKKTAGGSSMTIITAGVKFVIGAELKKFLHQKTEQKLMHFSERIHKVNITVFQEHFLYKVDCDVTSDFGEFFASVSNESVESAADQTLDKISAELRKKHDKVVLKKHPK